MSGVVIAAPMRLEAALVSSAARGAHVYKTGMGPRRALAAAAQIATTSSGAALLVLGFCGGLDAESVPGEVIVAHELCVEQQPGAPAELLRCELAGQLLARVAGRGLKVRSGRIVSVPRLALGERRAELLAGGAIAVDMESAWLAQGTERPFGVVRVVLDSPKHELLRPQFLIGALRAARALRTVAGALHDFSPGD
jgi:4-hydroxy-3-methylbut-2-enyl diphosphate reductase